MTGYLRTDEITDLISSLEHVSDCLAVVDRRPLHWKWVVIAAHAALQSAMIRVLSGTHNTGAYSEAAQKKWLKYFETGRLSRIEPPEDTRIASFMKLLEWIQEPSRMAGGFGGAPIVVSKDHGADIAKLHGMRNQFSHFSPTAWSIQKIGLPRIIATALRLTSALVEHQEVSYRLSMAQRKKLTAILKRSHRELRRLLVARK